LHELLNKQIPDDDGEKADHDFDLIRHDKNCDYSDSEKGIQIDVDKIIGSTQGEVFDVLIFPRFSAQTLNGKHW
jgi:hypothetical protein